jgi:hypothetical protein
MTFRTLLLIKAVVCLVFGLFLLLAPGVLLDLLGATLGDAGTFTAREYGAAMAGTLMLTWFARNTKATDARWAILLDLLIYDLIGMIVTMAAVLSGVLNVLGWAIFLVYLFFTAGSGYLLMKEKSVQPAHQ